METNRILVTGGIGAIGRPLVNLLRERGYKVWIADKPHYHDPYYIRCDVGEYRQVQKVFENKKFDFVYHLAAEFGRNNGEDYYESLWKSNAIGNKNMLQMQEKYKFKMIFTSSSEIYGDFPDIMYEDVPMKYPIRQLNDYAISKWVNELQILNSQDRFGTETVRLRLFNTYGPGEYFSEYRSVICQFVYKALHNLRYKVYLNHHRTSSFIDDTVDAMANIVDNFIPGEIYNICGDEYHDIKSISDGILNLLDKNDELVEYIEIEKHNTLDKKGDNTKAKKDLGYKASVNLEEGIKRTIEWQKTVF